MIQYFLQFVIGVIQIFRQQCKIAYTLQFTFYKVFFQSKTITVENIIWNDD